MKEEKQLYPGSQEDLYVISNAAWQYCNENIIQFNHLKSKYITAFIHNELTAIEVAKALPNTEVRGSTLKAMRVPLMAVATQCRSDWQDLSFFIGDSFAPELAPIMRQAAGSNYYAQATGDNWTGTDTMLTMATAFLAKEANALHNGGMSATFATQVATTMLLLQPPGISTGIQKRA